MMVVDVVKQKMMAKLYSFIFCFFMLLTIQAQKVDYSLWNNFLKKYVSNEGQVDYKTIKTNLESLNIVLKTLTKTMPDESWTKIEKLTFWINAYNAFTVDLIIRNYPIKSIKDIKNPWQQRLWKLGDTWYNLEEIEHEILRKMDEPRIHFAIVCASVSCPKLLNQAYSAENVESQLTQATKDFLNDSNRNSISTNNLELSKIFKWFSSDFTKTHSLIALLNLYTEIKISENAKIKYKDYNWNLND
tara:strand:+ start:1643 stop:2377 length:735 start_codon:yes stop_codon:yes gene_type:complete